MSLPRRAISADGTGIAWYPSGSQDARPVIVAIHGYPDNHRVWDGVVAELVDRYHVVTYDVRGTGGSDQPTGRSAYRQERLTDDLLAVLDASAPGRAVHVVAHDWGSVQAWPALADARLSGRIAGFTSISGPALDHAAVWLRQLRRHPAAALRQAGHSYYTLLFQLPALPELAVRAGLLDRAIALGNARGRRGAGSTATTDGGPPRSTADKLNGLNLYRANMTGRLRRPSPARIGVPVQVLAPADDPYVTAALATGAPEPFVDDLRCRVISGGHWVISEQPALIAGLVAEFVEQVENSS